MKEKKTIIIGAGLAGLSCAYHLKRDYEIYEKEAEAGGLCRSKKIGGFTFDFTGHLLHFKSHYVFNLVKRLLGDNFVRHNRSSWIFSEGVYVPYPFQVNTFGFPKETIKDCILGLIQKNGNIVKPQNFYEWMLDKFGAGITKHFMLPYNYKFWTTHPRNLTCEWLDGRVPLPELKDSIKGAFENSQKHWGYNWNFWYPRLDGISALPKAMERKISKISYSHKVKRIDIKKRTVTFVNLHSRKFDYIVSTTPLPELEKIIYPLPDKVRIALRKLKYLSIFNLNLGVFKNNLKDRHWVYFPENKFIFYRVGVFSNFSKNLTPKADTSLYIEASYSKDKPLKDKINLVNRIKSDLAKINIIQKENSIAAWDINDIEYGYVIYDFNCHKSRKIILDFLKENNIFSIGRFGGWQYLSMEDSILDGKNTAEMLNSF